MSTGNKINKLSDDLQNISHFFNLKGTLNNIENSLKTVNPLSIFFKGVESQYEDGFNLITRAIDIAQTASQTFLSSQDRLVLSEEVNQIIERMLNLSNLDNGGKNIITGKNAPLYKKVADAINYEYKGNKSIHPLFSENSVSLPDEKKVFGGFSGDYKGEKDLSPDITMDTRLSLLNFGKGVNLGKIIINNGINSFTVDLSDSEKISDVINRINNVDITISASLNPAQDGIAVSSTTGTITISSDTGYKTAEDLGIAGSSPSGTIIGTPLNPALSPDTPLNLLNNGTGINTAGFTIENKTLSGTIFSAVINILPTDTLGDFINKVNSSNTYTQAFISDDRRKINIVSTLQGGRLKLSEIGGGTTLTDLGIYTDLARTKLENIFGGLGLGKEEQTNDFSITRRDGVSFQVNLLGAITVQDLLDRINLNPQNTDTDGDTLPEVQAVIAGNQIILTDSSSGSNPLTISDENTNAIAQKLGIQGIFPSGTVTSVDLNPVGSQPDGLFSALLELRHALQTNDINLLKHSQKKLELARINFQTGQLQIADIASRLELVSNKLTQLKETFTLELSEISDVNLAEIIIEFQKEVTILQSIFATSAQILNLSLFNFLF
ncbi:MAG: hypothetical protein ACK4NF_00250 [Planctomycetota bacterium]